MRLEKNKMEEAIKSDKLGISRFGIHQKDVWLFLYPVAQFPG